MKSPEEPWCIEKYATVFSNTIISNFWSLFGDRCFTYFGRRWSGHIIVSRMSYCHNYWRVLKFIVYFAMKPALFNWPAYRETFQVFNNTKFIDRNVSQPKKLTLNYKFTFQLDRYYDQGVGNLWINLSVRSRVYFSTGYQNKCGKLWLVRKYSPCSN